MRHFLFEYSLFLSKTLTLLGVILIGAFCLLMIIASVRHKKNKNCLVIENINEQFDEMQDVLETEVLSEPEYKRQQKYRKQQEKQELKAAKKKVKQKATEATTEPRVFVLSFVGDVEASAVEELRECLNGLFTITRPQDEILLLLESPGGGVHQYGLAAAQLQRIKKQQLRLTVAVDLVAASGGYLMACIADKIIAAPFAVLGSIGVLAQLPNFNKLLKKHDIDIEHHTAGAHKTTLTLLGPNSAAGREKFQEDLESTHTLFKEFVHQHRPQIAIEQVATGEHWYGQQALAHHLVDEIMTSDEYLLQSAAKKEVYAVRYEIQESLKERLLRALETSLWQGIQKALQGLKYQKPY